MFAMLEHRLARAVGVLFVMVCVSLLSVGCKKKSAPDKGKAPEKTAPAAQKTRPAPEPKDTAQSDEPANDIEAPQPDTVGSATTAQLLEPPLKLHEPVEKPADNPESGQQTPSANTIKAPAVDRERLEKVFIELWCAEKGGATKEELLKMYHKYDYPPLANWHGVWNEAITDSIWAREVLEKARSKCWNLVKDKQPAAEKSPPTK